MAHPSQMVQGAKRAAPATSWLEAAEGRKQKDPKRTLAIMVNQVLGVGPTCVEPEEEDCDEQRDRGNRWAPAGRRLCPEAGVASQ